MIKKIQELREKTGVGFLACKQALEASNGNLEDAMLALRKQGQLLLDKRDSKTTENGRIHAYIHSGNIGVMVEVKCETDFTAKSPEFIDFANNVAMQIAAMNPEYISINDIPDSVLDLEKDIIKEQALAENKPAPVIEKMVEGRLKKYYSKVCLLNQAFIKDDKLTVQDVMNELVAKTKEKIEIRRFIRWKKGI